MRDKGGGPSRALPNKHLKLFNALKEYGWFLTRDEKHVLLKIYIYSRMENKVWCSKTWFKREIVQKNVTSAYTHDIDTYEIFVVLKALNEFFLMFWNMPISLEILLILMVWKWLESLRLESGRKIWVIKKNYSYFYVRSVSWFKSTRRG